MNASQQINWSIRPRRHVLRALVAALVLAAVPAPALAAGAPNSWHSVGDANAGRLLPTSTVLPDGRVLATGGSTSTVGSSTASSSAELFDPSTDTWTATPDMTVARAGHTATLLGSGKVLIVGGAATQEQGAGQASAELYDPEANTFTATVGAPTAGHSLGIAEPLPDGEVLIAGGDDVNGDATDAADIYDPKTDSFHAAAPMGTARADAVAAVLPDGRVLVAGGQHDLKALDSAEVYDPTADSWTRVGNRLSNTRVFASAAALPGGRVLVTGGEQDPGSLPLATADVYDASTNRFTATEGMGYPRALPAIAPLPGGRVLVAGGVESSNLTGDLAVIDTAEIYDPATRQWSDAPDLSVPRAAAGVAVLADGDVLVFGGIRHSTGLLTATSERYTPVNVPGAPTDAAATAGDGTARVDWAPPPDDGGSTVQHYLVTASPGGAHATTSDARTTAEVQGLDDGTAYTFTVRALNAIGDGPASAPSGSVTPTAPARMPDPTTTAATPAPMTTTLEPVHTPGRAAAAPRVSIRGLKTKVTRSQLLHGLHVSIVPSAPVRLAVALSAARRSLVHRALALSPRVRTVTLRPHAAGLPRTRRFTVTLVVTATTADGHRVRVQRSVLVATKR